MTVSQNKKNEISHGAKIEENAEFFWGWSTPAGRLRASRRAEMIINEIKSRGFKSVLEVGSGTGIFTEYFHKAGLEVSGIDISPELLEKARRKMTGSRPPKLTVADIDRLPYNDNSFDAVVGVCVLHHLNVESALREIMRVVKRDGIILFSEPNMMNPQLMIQKNIKPIKRLPILGETEDETAFFRWHLARLLKKTGFRDVLVTPFDFLHPWTPEFMIPLVRSVGMVLEKTPLLKEISGSLFIRAVK